MRQLRYCCCLVQIVYWQMKPFITEIVLKLKRVVFIKSIVTGGKKMSLMWSMTGTFVLTDILAVLLFTRLLVCEGSPFLCAV